MKVEAFHLKSKVATQELKSLDRFWHQQWSMLFNSVIHEKPYHNLNVIKILAGFIVSLDLIIQALHGCFQLMLWNCGSDRVINEYPGFIYNVDKIILSILIIYNPVYIFNTK